MSPVVRSLKHLLTFFCCLSGSASLSIVPSRILMIFPMAPGSEARAVHELGTKLASRGHQVTFVSSLKTGTVLSNYSELRLQLPLETEDFSGETGDIDILEHRKRYKKILPFYLNFNQERINKKCHQAYQDPGFQTIINQDYDLIIISGNTHHCFMGIVEKIGAPSILFHSIPYAGDEFQIPGIKMPSSFVPLSTLDFTDRMSFPQRVINFSMRLLFEVGYESFLAKDAEAVYRQYLGSDIPSLIEISRKVSMVFSNSHFTLSYSRPLTPDVVEVGCLQCRKPRPLDFELKKFVSSTPHGVIYFSMGSIFKISTFPPKLLSTILTVFSRLKQRVVFKSDDEQLAANVSSNVLVRKWVSQQDLLGHKNTKIFISHGGMQSALETSYHGVPMITLPIWGDQGLIGSQIEQVGSGIDLEILDLTAEKLETAIKSILTKPSYAAKAKRLSEMFRDQPQSPLEKAVYWAEYVIKYEGAPELRSAARDLHSFVYHGFDVLFFLLVCSLILIISLFLAAKRFYNHAETLSNFLLALETKTIKNSKSLSEYVYVIYPVCIFAFFVSFS